jgi:hypothetical protein
MQAFNLTRRLEVVAVLLLRGSGQITVELSRRSWVLFVWPLELVNIDVDI